MIYFTNRHHCLPLLVVNPNSRGFYFINIIVLLLLFQLWALLEVSHFLSAPWQRAGCRTQRADVAHIQLDEWVHNWLVVSITYILSVSSCAHGLTVLESIETKTRPKQFLQSQVLSPRNSWIVHEKVGRICRANVLILQTQHASLDFTWIINL